MSSSERFSERHGLAAAPAEITVRYEAPDRLRHYVPQLAESALTPGRILEVVCQVLYEPLAVIWGEDAIALNKIDDHLRTCEWYEVYDVVEALYARIADYKPSCAVDFEVNLNHFFEREGIGWQLKAGRIEIRGSEAFELVTSTALSALTSDDRETARREVREALADLSRRPAPDLSGAVQHAGTALECVARDATGDAKATFGEIVKRNPDLFPGPLRGAAHRLWGFASEQGRHLREGRDPSNEEVELVVGLVCALVTYLSRKSS